MVDFNSQEDGAIVISAYEGKHEIIISPFSDQNLDLALPAQENVQTWLDKNLTYQMHEHLRDMQLHPDSDTQYDKNFGNMEIGDRAQAESYLLKQWLSYAEQKGWTDVTTAEDLNNLTYRQWMELIAHIGELTHYDNRYNYFSPEYNKAAAKVHRLQTLSELFTGDDKGVCSTVVRKEIGAYEIADDLYNLSERGLGFLGWGVISDASHARGAFYVANTEQTVRVYGLDTYIIDDGMISSMDSSLLNYPDNTARDASWYLQQHGHRLVQDTEQIISVFQTFLDTYQGLAPVERAMITRQINLARLQQITDEIKKFDKKDTGSESGNINKILNTLDDLYNSIYEQIQSGINSNNITLKHPSRILQLFKDLETVAKNFDHFSGNTITNKNELKLKADEVRKLRDEYIKEHHVDVSLYN